MIRAMLSTVRHGVLIILIAPKTTTMIVSKVIGATIIIPMKVRQLKMLLLEIGHPILRLKVVHGLLKTQQKMPKVVGPTIVLIKLRIVGAKKILLTVPNLDGVSMVKQRIIKKVWIILRQVVI
jgi:hypothetical protein